MRTGKQGGTGEGYGIMYKIDKQQGYIEEHRDI